MRMKLAGRPEGVLTAQYIEASPEYVNGKRTGKQAVDDNGMPLWNVSCLLLNDGDKPELITVKMASDEMPEIPIGQKIECPMIVVPYIKDGRIAYSMRVSLKDTAKILAAK